ncbi:MAG: KamA family radical SAM protein [Lentisphaeria bacterium]
MCFWENNQKIDAELLELCKKSEAVHRQFYYDVSERSNSFKVLDDPIGDSHYSPVRGLVHRYADRALLLVSMNCPSQCRFCFRKNIVGQELELSDNELENIFDYLKYHEEIKEVIISGGEPLLIGLDKLQKIIDIVSSLPNIRNLRIHTRLPLTAPSIAESFFDNKVECKLPMYFVVHCNHYDEITESWKRFIFRAKENGIVILTQTVLLKGVNADVDILARLFNELLKNGVLPYYLHHPDQVKGTDHFRITLDEGRDIYRGLRGRLSGIGIPRYILDIPGGLGKVEADSAMVKHLESNMWEIFLPNGQVVKYQE